MAQLFGEPLKAAPLALFAEERTEFFIFSVLVQNDPDEAAQLVRDRPDGFRVTEAGQQLLKNDLEVATLSTDRGLRGLAEYAP